VQPRDTASRRGSTGRISERGAAAVELVVILPLILTLILGSLAIGTAYFYKLNLTEGAREGARVAATLRTGYNPPNPDIRTGVPTNAWLLEVANVATSTAGRWETVCVTYTGHVAFRPPGSTTTRTVNITNGGTPTFSGDPCFSDDRGATERRVQVRITDTGPFDNFFFTRQTLTLEGRALARFQRPYTAVDL
jgi:Flp pilus assembly protein TadG